MARPDTVLSRTMQSISLTKIKEIEKQRDKYEVQKNEVLAGADEHPTDQRTRITQLLRGVEELYPEVIEDNRVKNIRFWLEQSRYDASVPAEMLESSERVLRSKLEVQSRKLALAHLYSRLITEWMESSTPMGGGDSAAAAESESFEVVDRQKERLQELCDKFERVVFEPLDTDETDIDNYIREMFEGDEATEALQDLQQSIDRDLSSMVRNRAPFDETVVDWCVNGLLAEDLLSDEKQAVLRDILENKVVLREIVDVLNMRFADFEKWDWDAGEQGIPVLPRQQLNGKYRIWMDEDVIQAIFIHYVGVLSCVALKEALTTFITEHDNEKIWRWQTTPALTEIDELRRRYYLAPTRSPVTIKEKRRDDYIDHFFLAQLPDSVHAIKGNSYDNDSRDDDGDSAGDNKPGNIKQKLLHTLASEVVLQRSTHGEVALIQSDLQWFATGLSHTTIFAVMRFFGFPEAVIAFFKKVLRAPLNLNPSSDGASSTSGSPRTRKRGVPMAHAPEKLIGELVLFVMDLAVNKETGLLMYRLHDDLFLCGEPARCVKAWETMKTFAKVMGLEFNRHKTGSVYLYDGWKGRDPKISHALPEGAVRIGHLVLNPKSGEWIIDQKQVAEHVNQLGRQLAACNSILDYVQTWNSCVSRFFSHSFGEPGFCFGVKHVDSILETYQQMQNTLFRAGSTSPPSQESVVGQPNVVQDLKKKIRERLGVSDVPDAFIYLPEQLGGLGLRNPFIPLLMVREYLSGDMSTPQKIMRKCLVEEREKYTRAKKAFEALGTVDRKLGRFRHASVGKADLDVNGSNEEILRKLDLGDGEEFFEIGEYMRWRERTSEPLAFAYINFQKTPLPSTPELDRDVERFLNAAGFGKGGRGGTLSKRLEIRWAVQMYGDELRTQYGGLKLAEEKYLPLGLLAMMRRKVVRWNLVL